MPTHLILLSGKRLCGKDTFSAELREQICNSRATKCDITHFSTELKVRYYQLYNNGRENTVQSLMQILPRY